MDRVVTLSTDQRVVARISHDLVVEAASGDQVVSVTSVDRNVGVDQIGKGSGIQGRQVHHVIGRTGFDGNRGQLVCGHRTTLLVVDHRIIDQHLGGLGIHRHDDRIGSVRVDVQITGHRVEDRRDTQQRSGFEWFDGGTHRATTQPLDSATVRSTKVRTNRLQPGTKPHDTPPIERCRILVLRNGQTATLTTATNHITGTTVKTGDQVPSRLHDSFNRLAAWMQAESQRLPELRFPTDRRRNFPETPAPIQSGTCHSRTFLSRPAEARRLPSVENSSE